jgi:hypothetical protein
MLVNPAFFSMGASSTPTPVRTTSAGTGQRLLIMQPSAPSTTTQLNVIVNRF